MGGGLRGCSRCCQVEEDAGDTREEKTFRMWVNSLNLEGSEGPGSLLFVSDLYYDLCAGTPILKVQGGEGALLE